MKNFKKATSVLLAILLVFTALGSSLAASATDLPFTYRESSVAVEIIGCDKTVVGDIVIPAKINSKPVTSIANWAFSNCKTITSVEIPDSVTYIGEWAFLNCKALANINLPASLKTTGIGTFRACVSLSEIEIPKSLVSLNANLFDGCSLLSSVNFVEGSTLGTIGKEAFLNCINLSSLSIPNSVYTISENAFKGCTSMDKIRIMDRVQSIGANAFDTNTVIYCSYESKAHAYADQAKIPHVITDTFYAIYKVDGNVVAEVPYSFENGIPAITSPVVPVKPGYNGSWESFSIKEGGMVINAVYSIKTAFAVFMADGEIIAEIPYTVDNAVIEEPVVPEKEDYNGRWQEYTLNGNSVEIKAIYTPIESVATFVADGKLVGTVVYNVNTAAIAVPNVPEKDGYFGTWETFELVRGGITVNARYIRIVPDSIFISSTNNKVEYGQTVKLVAKISPYNTLDQEVIWESSDDSIITIETDASDSRICYLTHAGAGDAVITVTVLDENGERTDVMGTLNITAGEFSVGQTISNRILGFFAKVMSFMNIFSAFNLGK